MSIQRTFRLSDENDAGLCALAGVESRPVSQMLNVLLREALVGRSGTPRVVPSIPGVVRGSEIVAPSRDLSSFRGSDFRRSDG